MFEKIRKNRLQEFKKKHFLRLIYYVRRKCTLYFGYSNAPYVFETELAPGVMMSIHRSPIRKNTYAIFYDYKKFKKVFGNKDFDVQLGYCAHYIAHEMRHYYQMRQLDSDKPRERDWLLERWRNDEENPFPDEVTDENVLEFFKTPMEIDAELFAHWFVAQYFDLLISFDNIDKSYINELEKYHIELFGETDEMLFPKE